MNALPVVADLKPKKVGLRKGETYHFCACGQSANQPFCDGSHQGTGIAPQAFVAQKDGDAYLCQCKRTGNPPYCDGTHSKVPAESKGRPPN